ncbi:response regulator NasT [Elusimicrobium posterum]|uniref:ANTAR domain-containing response regulator n=1 Tax=Elusimicrobium posterum TaxID=3116653 RepID=UPI003C706DEC
MTQSVMIVSCINKETAFFIEMLNLASINQVAALHSCAEARRFLLERDFDLVIINTPLRDESGESLARNIASKGTSQVIISVKEEHFDAVSSVCEEDGILVIAKPLSRHSFWPALTLAKSAQNRLKRIQAENEKLKQKVEDIRIINRAKWILISYMNMSEIQAHKHIEKHAMDTRTSRREVAEKILKTYDN